jgi:hypothetical protein
LADLLGHHGGYFKSLHNGSCLAALGRCPKPRPVKPFDTGVILVGSLPEQAEEPRRQHVVMSACRTKRTN